MCSINHDLKCVYLHTPKCGGSYVTDILERFYNFKTFYFTSEHHENFVDDKLFTFKNYSTNKGFFFIKKNMYKYFRYSEKFNILTGMDEDKWKKYFKFTFVRHPFDKFISAFKYLKLYEKNINLNDILTNKNILNSYEYFHLLIPLFDTLINDENILEFNYIGKYEYLNQELIDILKIIGIDEIKHKNCILNNIIINSSDDNKFISNIDSTNDTRFTKTSGIDQYLNMIDEKFIQTFNDYFSKDFEYFDYDLINLNNFKNYIQNKKNIILLNHQIIAKYNLNENNKKLNKNNKKLNKNYDEKLNSDQYLLSDLEFIKSQKNKNNKILKYL